MVDRSSHVAESPNPRRLGTEWFLDAVFPNGRAVTIRGLAGESEAGECSGSFRYVKSTCGSRGWLSPQAAVPVSRPFNARASDSPPVEATLPGRTKLVWSPMNGTGLDGQTLPATFERSPSGLISLPFKSLRWLSEKWRAATSSPWFALVCAAGSFVALIAFTGVLAALALTVQPAGTDMVTGLRVGASMQHERPQAIERDYDNDPIAVLIERTSRPAGLGVGPASLSPTPAEVEREAQGKSKQVDSVPAATPTRLPDAPPAARASAPSCDGRLCR